jgi:cysteine desulfurase
MIRNDTILVSICSVDSELGLVQPIEEIAKILKEYPNCYFHTDASQAIGKVDIDFTNVDLITIAPHKFYGMNGFGALIKKKDVSLKPIINGGKSTTVYRSGTPVLASVVAFDKALDIAITKQKERYSYIEKLNKEVKEKLLTYPNVHINSTVNSIPHTINFSIRGVKSLEFAKKLEEHEIYLSTKTSCCPTETPSKLVFALTHDKSLASTSLRLSLSHLTTEEELEEFYKAFDSCYKEFN